MKQIPEVAKAPAESQFYTPRYFCIPEVSVFPTTSASFTQEILGVFSSSLCQLSQLPLLRISSRFWYLW